MTNFSVRYVKSKNEQKRFNFDHLRLLIPVSKNNLSLTAHHFQIESFRIKRYVLGFSEYFHELKIYSYVVFLSEHCYNRIGPIDGHILLLR